MEEFAIPLKPEDLLRPAVEDDYRVEDEIDPENLSEKQAQKFLEGKNSPSLIFNFFLTGISRGGTAIIT